MPRIIKMIMNEACTPTRIEVSASMNSKPSRALAAIAAVVLSAIFIASAVYSPAPHRPYEQYFTLCVFKIFTGLPCPACGLTHSFCALAKGDLLGALNFNLLGPALFLILVFAWMRSLGVMFDKTKFVLALDSAAERFKLLRAIAVAFALFGAARIVYVLIFYSDSFNGSPLARLFEQVFR